jgi:sporulation protein YlmC with PRC-barrel domain
MLRRVHDLQKYAIAAADGELGNVSDFYFDDQSWVVRYVVVDTGGWLPGRLVLISPDSIQQPDDARRCLPVSLTRQQVEHSPGIEAHLPFSRRQEVAYREYFGWPPYWGGLFGSTSFGLNPEAIAVAEHEAERHARAAENVEPHLRSTGDIAGYHIRASDGGLGHVSDFIIDDETWAIRYLVVDTRDWLPGKRVLVAPEWVDAIDWPASDVVVDLPRGKIKDAPAYDEHAPLTREYESRLHAYYGQPAYWSS